MNCPDCRRHIAEIMRLRQVVAQQDGRILRMQQQHAEHNERMEAATTELRRSTDGLIREIQR